MTVPAITTPAWYLVASAEAFNPRRAGGQAGEHIGQHLGQQPFFRRGEENRGLVIIVPVPDDGEHQADQDGGARRGQGDAEEGDGGAAPSIWAASSMDFGKRR